MKPRSKREKFVIAGLGVVCAFVAFKLISDIRGTPVEATRGQKTPAQTSGHPAGASKPLGKAIDKIANEDFGLEVKALQQYVARRPPSNVRDPFDFAAPPPPKNIGAGSGGAMGGGVGGSAVSPSVEISLRAIGYSLRRGVGGEAYLTDADQVYIVHRGNVLKRHFVVVSITPTIVEVQDESSGESVQLPIPQVQ